MFDGFIKIAFSLWFGFRHVHLDIGRRWRVFIIGFYGGVMFLVSACIWP
jgi:hypothetical protein